MAGFKVHEGPLVRFCLNLQTVLVFNHEYRSSGAGELPVVRELGDHQSVKGGTHFRVLELGAGIG